MKIVDGLKDSKTGKGRFERLYICFAGVKHGFLAGCKQFIGVDDTFLKGLVGGVLLAAVGVDANNGIFPIAYATAKDFVCSSAGFKGESSRRAFWTIAKETTPPQFISRMEEMAEIDKNTDRTPDCFPFKSNDDLYEVSCPYSDQYAVNIKEQICSCRKWELTGIPCPHAIVALWMVKKDPLLYVLKWYTVKTYMKCYEGLVCPMNEESELGLTDVGEGSLPPLYGRAPGRPKKLRRRSAEEIQQSKEKTKKKKRQQCTRRVATVVCNDDSNTKYQQDAEPLVEIDITSFASDQVD
nr:uncharacterized protein LOC113714186 [Coffea arabica]